MIYWVLSQELRQTLPIELPIILRSIGAKSDLKGILRNKRKPEKIPGPQNL